MSFLTVGKGQTNCTFGALLQLDVELLAKTGGAGEATSFDHTCALNSVPIVVVLNGVYRSLLQQKGVCWIQHRIRNNKPP